jgi:hypothetical protein
MAIADPDEKDWRLRLAPALDDPKPALAELLKRLRGEPPAIPGAASVVADDVVITHDAELLFAYAASESALNAARASIEAALRDQRLDATITVSHWDEDLFDWRQVDPPLGDSEEHARKRSDDAAMASETRTVLVKVGREVRSEVERSLQISAAELGVECKLVEHPHLLRTQVAFTATGPHRKVEQFFAGLRAEERATIRTERAVMASPL